MRRKLIPRTTPLKMFGGNQFNVTGVGRPFGGSLNTAMTPAPIPDFSYANPTDFSTMTNYDTSSYDNQFGNEFSFGDEANVDDMPFSTKKTANQAKKAGGKKGGGGGGLGMIDTIGNLATTLTKVGHTIGMEQIEKTNPTSYSSRGIRSADQTKGKASLRGIMDSSNTGGGWISDMASGLTTAFKNMGKGKELLAADKRRYNVETQAGRNQDMLSMYSNQIGLAREGIKIKFNKLIEDSPKKLLPVFQAGGTANIIPKGNLHKENNDIAGPDKGIPVVDAGGQKLYEIEKEEIILNLELTKTLEELVDTHSKTKDDQILVDLGKILTAELLSNTQDNTEKFVENAVENR